MKVKHLGEYLRAQDRELQHWSAKGARKLNRRVVHQLRVCTRRIRAVLWMVKKRSPNKKLKRKLRRLGHELGEIRQLDVAIQDAKSYQLKNGKLKRRRRKLARELRSRIQKIDFEKIHSQINAVIDRIQNLETVRMPEPLELKGKSPADLHKFRIAVKKARYVNEALGKPTGPLERAQSALGRAHDLELLLHLEGQNRAVKRDLKKFERRATHFTQSLSPPIT